MDIPDRKSSPKPDTQFHQSAFISCRPIAAGRGLVRRNPDLVRKRGILERKFSKIRQQKSLKTVVFRQIVVEVTGYEPATFWSRILSSVGHPIPARPVESCCDWICSDGKVPSVGGFAWQTTGRMVLVVMDNRSLFRVASRVCSLMWLLMASIT